MESQLTSSNDFSNEAKGSKPKGKIDSHSCKVVLYWKTERFGSGEKMDCFCSGFFSLPGTGQPLIELRPPSLEPLVPVTHHVRLTNDLSR